MSEEVRDLRARMKDFIDNVVMKAEPELDRLAEQGYHPETGLPLELYAAAEAKGLDTSRGVPGPGDAATRRSSGPIADLREEAKARGLWALGHPAEIGCGGLPHYGGGTWHKWRKDAKESMEPYVFGRA